MAADITGVNFSQLRPNIISLSKGCVIPEPSHAEWSICRESSISDAICHAQSDSRLNLLDQTFFQITLSPSCQRAEDSDSTHWVSSKLSSKLNKIPTLRFRENFASQRFWYAVFLFSLSSIYFLIYFVASSFNLCVA